MKRNKGKKLLIGVLMLALLAGMMGCGDSKQEEAAVSASSPSSISSSSKTDKQKEEKKEDTKKDNTKKKETEKKESKMPTNEPTAAPTEEPAVTPEPTEEAEGTGTWRDHFEQSGSMYYTTVTSGTPVQGGGLSVIVDTSDASVTYTITDTAGNETVEYLFVNYGSGQVERYQYVSAMGQGFYYYSDLNGNNLSVFNTEGEDRTAGAQESGHYDPAVESTKSMISSYSSFFSSAFGISPDQAAYNN